MSLTTVEEGWTGRLLFTVSTDGVAGIRDVAGAVVTGLTLELVLKDRAGGTVPVSGSQYGWVTDGVQFFYDPGPADLQHDREPYRVRAKITDGLGKVVYFPNAEPGELRVLQV